MIRLIKEEKQPFRTPYDAVDFYEITYSRGGKDDIIKDLRRRGYGAMFIANVFEIFEENEYNNEEDYELDDYDECLDESNVKEESRKMYKESSSKSYWKYSVLDPVFDRDEDDDTYISKYDIRRVKLIPCNNPDECYDDIYSAVCDYEYPYKEFYGTKQDAYDMLLTSWNNSTFERIHDI